MKYKKQYAEAEAEISAEELEKIKNSIKKRLKTIKEMEQEIINLNREIEQLMIDGKITDLGTAIQFSDGLGNSAGLHIALSR